MSPKYIDEGDTVARSPVGPGVVTDITDAGYPRVNHVAVAWMIRTDGVVFNPLGLAIPNSEEDGGAANG